MELLKIVLTIFCIAAWASLILLLLTVRVWKDRYGGINVSWGIKQAIEFHRSRKLCKQCKSKKCHVKRGNRK